MLRAYNNNNNKKLIKIFVETFIYNLSDTLFNLQSVKL